MAKKPFKASNVRRRVQLPGTPVARAVGRAMPPNVGIQRWYQNKLNAMIKELIAEVRAEVESIIANAKQTQDAKFVGIINLPSAFQKLRLSWSARAESRGSQIAKTFLERCSVASRSSVISNITEMGVEPTPDDKSKIDTTLQAALKINTRLITEMGEKYMDEIGAAVKDNIIGGEDKRPLQERIETTLRTIGEREGVVRRRADLIARDQTSKAFAELNAQRMADNGVTKFIWRHSSAGKTHRKVHEERDGMTFNYSDFPGHGENDSLPGIAINCRCVAIPVIDLDFD